MTGEEVRNLVAVPDLMQQSEAPTTLCIIRDMTSSQNKIPRMVLNLNGNTPARTLVEDVALKSYYVADTFELVFQKTDGNLVVLNENRNLSLIELGFNCYQNARNNLVISDKDGSPPIKIEVSDISPSALDDLTLGASSSSPLPSSNYTSPSTDFRARENCCTYNSKPIVKTDTGYVGLVNQAMTCYLNSLLQTLFLTPEFRNALYSWEFDGVEEEGVKSIPYQLQKLFLHLQTSSKHAIGTTELTRSFGWDSSEAWQQHDVQELCRVMFDALECKFKNTDQADLINRLYQGKIKDYVKCLKCGCESAREDSFLDIPLVVRPFGASESYGSIDEAMKAFVQPEILDGSNQYFCEKCNKKCDAHKGLKFLSFPYLLTLQLKRFDFDYNTMHRIKLNDRLTFPEVLNLNGFLKEESEECNSDDCDTTDSGSALDYDASSNHGNSISNIDVMQDDDEGIDIDDNRRVVENQAESDSSSIKSNEKGPYQYELFSVMIHSGSASGGHYYVYIKSFENGQWYSFNDQEVSTITIDDVRRTFGGGPNRSTYASSTNAYMLIYRQIDKELNKSFIETDVFPEHLKALQQCMLEEEERDRAQKEIDKSYHKIKLYCNHPTKKRMVDSYLRVHKDISISDATAIAHKILILEDVIPLEQCRLVKYDGLNDSLICSFEDCMDQPIGELIGNNKFDLLLETRPPDKQFECYKVGGISVKVNVINLESEAILMTKPVRGYLTQTIGEFKEVISKELELPVEGMRLILDKGCTDMKPLVSPEKTLKDEGFYYTNKVFVECSRSEDSEKPFESSKLYKILERYSHTTCIYVTLPNVDKDIIERMSIPRYGEPAIQNNAIDINAPTKKAVPLYLSPEIEEGMNIDNYDPLDDMSNLNVHSDQSEDSSLTDSDRTLIGDEISPRNNSPEPLSCNPSCLVNSLSEIELMSASMRNSSASNSPQDDLCEDDRNVSSPEENSSFPKSSSGTMNWVCTTINCDYGLSAGSCYNSSPSPVCDDVKCYFRAWPFNDTETGDKMLRVYVDKRITVGALKKDLESYVGVPMEHFKVYRVYSNHQELECSRLSENLMSFGEDCKLVIKLGRALKKGEHKVKIFQFLPNDSEPIRYLMDWIFYNGMLVLEAKKQLIPELKEKFNMDIPITRCRLRKKSWKNPSSIFLDTQKFNNDISIYSNWEIFVEILSENERFNSTKELAIFTRRWRCSLFKLDPIVEVLLDSTSFSDLKSKLSEISGIEESNIEVAKGQGTYPCDQSLLSISQEMEWHSQSISLSGWPLYISDDGFVIYYKDNSEKEKELTEEEKKELSSKGSSKLTKVSRTYSPRKEKALKIYMDISPSTTNSQDGATAS